MRVGLIGLERGRGGRGSTVPDARGPAEEDECSASVHEPWRVPLRADDDVVIAVAVRVARARDGNAEVGVRLVGVERGRGGRGSAVRDAGRTAEEDERLAARVVAQRADDHVVVSVAVRVARARDALAEDGAGLLGLERGRGGHGSAVGHSVRAAEEDERCALQILAQGVAARADDDVVVAVAVDVARARHAVAEAVLARLAQERGRGGRGAAVRDAGRAAEKDERSAVAARRRVVALRADDHVVVSVAVRVARARHPEAELGVAIVRLERRGGRRIAGQATRSAAVDERRALGRLPRVVGARADDDVVESVAVRVARRRHSGTEERRLLVGLNRGGRCLRVPARHARRPAEEDERRALVQLAAVVVGRPDQDVVVSVAVDVARSRHRGAEQRAVLIRLERGRGGRRRAGLDAGRRAAEDERGALVGLARIVPTRPDDDVREAVAVRVARARDRDPEVGVDLVGLEHGARGGVAVRDADRAAEEDDRDALVRLARVVAARTHDHVVEAVAVRVAGARDALPETGVGLVGLERGGGGRRVAADDAREPAEKDESRALVRLARVVSAGADDDVREAVAVDVARTRDADAEGRACLVGLKRGRGRRGAGVGHARGAAEEDESGALVGLARVVCYRADEDVVVAVAVRIADARDGVAEDGVGLVGLKRRRGARGAAALDARRTAQEDEGGALVGLTRVVALGADDDVVVAVAVDVAGTRDAAPEEGADLIGFELCEGRRGERRVDCDGVDRLGVVDDHSEAALGSHKPGVERCADRVPRRQRTVREPPSSGVERRTVVADVEDGGVDGELDRERTRAGGARDERPALFEPGVGVDEPLDHSRASDLDARAVGSDMALDDRRERVAATDGDGAKRDEAGAARAVDDAGAARLEEGAQGVGAVGCLEAEAGVGRLVFARRDRPLGLGQPPRPLGRGGSLRRVRGPRRGGMRRHRRETEQACRGEPAMVSRSHRESSL